MILHEWLYPYHSNVLWWSGRVSFPGARWAGTCSSTDHSLLLLHHYLLIYDRTRTLPRKVVRAFTDPSRGPSAQPLIRLRLCPGFCFPQAGPRLRLSDRPCKLPSAFDLEETVAPAYTEKQKKNTYSTLFHGTETRFNGNVLYMYVDIYLEQERESASP